MSSGLIDTITGVPPALENSPAVLPPDGTARNHWAVVLAGGDGTRLQSLALKIAGDRRPKQFCSFFGGETLLAQTRARLESLFHFDRELFVVTRSHEKYYREELRNVAESRIIPQPLSEGKYPLSSVAARATFADVSFAMLFGSLAIRKPCRRECVALPSEDPFDGHLIAGSIYENSFRDIKAPSRPLGADRLGGAGRHLLGQCVPVPPVAD